MNHKLQLGCGSNILPGWINTDMYGSGEIQALDFTQPLPIADNILDAVFCEHTIEHVEKPQAIAMCAEVFRTLKNGGVYRIVTPSLENMARLALLPDNPVTQRYISWFRGFAKMPDATISDAVNAMFYHHGHRHLYMRDEMGDMLQRLGFVDLKFYQSCEYGYEVFQGVDSHGKWIGEDINAIESFAVEVRKP